MHENRNPANGGIVGAVMAVALLTVFIVLVRKGKIRKTNLKFGFSRPRPPPAPRLHLPVSKYQLSASTFLLNRKKRLSSSGEPPQAHTYSDLGHKRGSFSGGSSFSRSRSTEGDEETVEVQQRTPSTARILSTVMEEEARRNSSLMSPPLAYPESVFTRSSRLLPSMRNSVNRGELTTPPTPMVRRASDPPSPPTLTARNSATGPWRDSMWSVGSPPPGGSSSSCGYPPTSRSSIRLSHRASRSVNWDSLQQFGTSNSWAENSQGQHGGLDDESIARQQSGTTYPVASREAAVPAIPPRFLVGRTMGATGPPPPLADHPSMRSGPYDSGRATVFRQHPGDLIQF